MIKTEKKPTTLGIVLKSIGVLIAVVLFLSIGAFIIENVTDEYNYDNDLGRMVNACDGYYYERKYGNLREYMTLYELYDKEFDMYWEIVEGYGDYIDYGMYKSAYETGYEEYYDEVMEFAEKVKDNAKNCKFDKNRETLQKFVMDIEE